MIILSDEVAITADSLQYAVGKADPRWGKVRCWQTLSIMAA